MEYVYWIKRKNFDDPYTEGYVGISNNPTKRFIAHKTRSDNPHLKRALDLYEDIEIIILHECSSRDEVVALERLYRPRDHVGWNINMGGDTPPRNHLTSEVRSKISDTLKNKNICPYNERTHSPEAIEKRKASMLGRKWFYNPSIDESVLSHEQPEGWLPGRKLVESCTLTPKTRGVDYVCHVATWSIVDPEGNLYEVVNLKKWCEERRVPYLRVYQSQCGWSAQKINNT